MSDVDPAFLEEIQWLNAIDLDSRSSIFSETRSLRPVPIDIPSPRSSTASYPAKDSLDLRRNSNFKLRTTPHLRRVLTDQTRVPASDPSKGRMRKGRTSPIDKELASVSAPTNTTTITPGRSRSPGSKQIPRSEWLYRRPNYPRGRSATSPSSTSLSVPTTESRSRLSAHGRSYSDGQPVRPMKPAYAAETAPVLETRANGCRSPSLTSTTSSVTTIATSSSRPVTPVSPGSKPSFRTHHPSKSILTRTSSSTTKNSIGSSNCNKSVKFVEMPTIHHPSAGYWDMDGIDVTNMDVGYMDEDARLPADPYRNARELLCQTPTPGKERAKGLSRFLKRRTSHKSKPSISGPFALGSIHAHPLMDPASTAVPTETASIRSTSTVGSTSRAPSKPASLSTGVPLRPAPSLESFKSARSTSGRSVRSMGSIGSTTSINRFRSWLDRMGSSFRGEGGFGIS
ncbi:hypothetical protein HGRIS_007420 [Hohenbuehelia grisea]|uniref:Uncharacterized protein n=1 Tax=Hohenbuehelia grisea TaxID=104357 RepID=A0ABR3J4S2_9AGAR